MSAAIKYATLALEEMTCGSCGIIFAAPQDFFNERRRGGANAEQGWYCPNGHSRVFRETEAQKLQRELDSARKSLEFEKAQRANAEREREATERRLSAQFGENTKLRKRISHGVCPCCHRTFKQVAAHMAKKHPEYPQVTPKGDE